MINLLHFFLLCLLSFSTCVTAKSLPAPQDSRSFFIDSAQLPFADFPIPGIETEKYWGELKGAGYRIEVPTNWNGELVMWAHGFLGNGEQLFVENHPLRLFLISQGFAWAASSYTKNFYDVRSGVQSTNDLVRFFKENIAEPNRVFISGVSMGGHITAAAIEQFPNYQCPQGSHRVLCKRIVKLLGRISGGVKYSGAVPVCGVMADREGLIYGVNYRLVAEQLAGLNNQFPTSADYTLTTLPQVIARLFADNGEGYPHTVSPQGEKLKDYLRYSTGGARPVFDLAFGDFQDTVFASGLGNGTLDGITGGNLYDNLLAVYQLDGDPTLSAEEQALNAAMLRVALDPQADPERFLKLERIPILTGRLSVPVVTLHTLGDLRVPFSNQQIYYHRAAAKGRSNFLVQRAIRDIGHCTFEDNELIEAFVDMYQWATNGIKPEGDDIITPDVVSDKDYGCKFTRRTRSELGIDACPQ
ncbi:hypothetical protein [Agarilytica rhodophyticola]|uniref:hypothetical protein n=1 Tax=Agarilytica rhodophyticola TaxID=1737490 RepID=UPI000B3494C1|nr:hypothetical protein [Agarilytica rhodophyticola]